MIASVTVSLRRAATTLAVDHRSSGTRMLRNPAGMVFSFQHVHGVEMAEHNCLSPASIEESDVTVQRDNKTRCCPRHLAGKAPNAAEHDDNGAGEGPDNSSASSGP